MRANAARLSPNKLDVQCGLMQRLNQLLRLHNANQNEIVLRSLCFERPIGNMRWHACNDCTAWHSEMHRPRQQTRGRHAGTRERMQCSPSDVQQRQPSSRAAGQQTAASRPPCGDTHAELASSFALGTDIHRGTKQRATTNPAPRVLKAVPLRNALSIAADSSMNRAQGMPCSQP